MQLVLLGIKLGTIFSGVGSWELAVQPGTLDSAAQYSKEREVTY
jgi:hypothetical protein